MLRAIILSLVLALGLGLMIPLASDDAEAGSVITQKEKNKAKSREKKYSKYYLAKFRKTKRFLKSQKDFVAEEKKAPATPKGKESLVAKNKPSKMEKVLVINREKPVDSTLPREDYSPPSEALASNDNYYMDADVGYSPAELDMEEESRANQNAYNVTRTASSKKRNSSSKRKVKKTRSKGKSVAKRKPKTRSKAWWKNYQAKKIRKKRIEKAKRAVRLRAIRVANSKHVVENVVLARQSPLPISQQESAPIELPDLSKQDPWYKQTLQTGIAASLPMIGSSFGNLEILSPAVGPTVSTHSNSMVGGINTKELRRTVIDEMINQNGWVENDYEKEIGGKTVYVVVAKAPDENNEIKSRTYYFTESKGSVYKLATVASEGENEQVARQSELEIENFQKGMSNSQQALNEEPLKKDALKKDVLKKEGLEKEVIKEKSAGLENK